MLSDGQSEMRFCLDLARTRLRVVFFVLGMGVIEGAWGDFRAGDVRRLVSFLSPERIVEARRSWDLLSMRYECGLNIELAPLSREGVFTVSRGGYFEVGLRFSTRMRWSSPGDDAWFGCSLYPNHAEVERFRRGLEDMFADGDLYS